MIKKSILAVLSLVFGVALMAAPTKANAQVVVGVAPRPYVYVAPPVVAPPYYGPYYGRVYVRGHWYPRAYAYRHYGYYGPRGYWRR